jgi:hypothetical protein
MRTRPLLGAVSRERAQHRADERFGRRRQQTSLYGCLLNGNLDRWAADRE